MNVHDFTVDDIYGQVKALSDFRGKLLLIVNTASNCGFSPQYFDLQHLFEKYSDRGFVVLGFPCNQFGRQEPRSNRELLALCESTYRVSFPLFSKIHVKGPTAHPLYQYLTSRARGVLGSKAIKWNFTKFLVDRQGEVIKRYAPMVNPLKIGSDIERALTLTQVDAGIVDDLRPH